MKDIFHFINHFIQVEFEYSLTVWTEKNNNIYQEKKYLIYRFYAPNIPIGGDRPISLPKNWFEMGQNELQYIAPRTLFQIKECKHPIFERIYSCYLSNNANYSLNKYFSLFYIIPKNNNFKIIAVYNLEYSTTQIKWKYLAGVHIEKELELIETYKIKPPQNPLHLKDYNDNL